MRFLPSNRVWAASVRSSNTMKCARAQYHLFVSLTAVFLQQIQDVKDKLEDLIPWVAKLEETLMRSNAKDPDEVERRTQLEGFVPSLFYLSTLE